MTKVGSVRLRLVKPFNVKTDKMFAEVFAFSSNPSQYVHARHIKRKSLIQRVLVYACHTRKYSVPFI